MPLSGSCDYHSARSRLDHYAQLRSGEKERFDPHRTARLHLDHVHPLPAASVPCSYLVGPRRHLDFVPAFPIRLHDDSQSFQRYRLNKYPAQGASLCPILPLNRSLDQSYPGRRLNQHHIPSFIRRADTPSFKCSSSPGHPGERAIFIFIADHHIHSKHHRQDADDGFLTARY